MLTETRDARALGNITKFASPPLRERAGYGLAVGETRQPNDTDASRERRLRRYDLQRVAARLVPTARVAGCCWRPVGQGVEIIKHTETHKAHYGPGVMHCGSVWLCPVCASKITERRRLEIKQGLDNARARGWSVFMVTFTMSHNRGDEFPVLLDALVKTLRQFRSGAPWQRRRAKYQIVGDIRGIETTVSKSTGWHVHSHMLFFSECQPDQAAIQADFAARYTAILAENGQFASLEHGVNVRIGDTAAGDYVAKMGMEAQKKPAGLDFEIAKSGQKSGRDHGHYTPFELLELAKAGDEWAGRMFTDYAKTMQGVNQIRWSAGLRDSLEVGSEITDDEITAGVGDTGGKLYYTIPNPDFVVLRSWGGRVYTGVIVQMAADTPDAEIFARYLATLLQIAHTAHSGPRTNETQMSDV